MIFKSNKKNSSETSIQDQIAYGLLKTIAIVTGILILLWFLYKIKVIVAYIIMAAVFSLIGRPMVTFLEKKLKCNNTLAVIATLMVNSMIIGGMFLLLIPIISRQSQLISQINFNQVGSNIYTLVENTDQYLQDKDINLSVNQIVRNIHLPDIMSFKSIPELINALISSIGSLFVGSFCTLFITFFFLKDRFMLERTLSLFETENKIRLRTAFKKIKELLSRYFLGLLTQAFILFILYSIIFTLFDIESSIMIALIASILNLIPFIGPLIGAVLVGIVTGTSFIGMDFSEVILPKIGYVLLCYLGVQLIDNFLNQPLIFGNSVRSHPLEIFISILIFGILFGTGGLIIAVPCYTTIKVIASAFLSQYRIVKQLTRDL